MQVPDLPEPPPRAESSLPAPRWRARLATLSASEKEIRAKLGAFARHLADATGSEHHLVLARENGAILATSEGVLADGLAELSRRLGNSVRRERYGSAHLVAVRVRRELETPLQDMEARVAMLERLLPSDSDERRVCGEIAASLAQLAAMRRRLGEVPRAPHPGGSA